ncbi:MAG: hypothetical protein ABI193_04685 [Minicystis sp.]
MSPFPPEVLALAESLNLHMPRREGEECLVTPRYAAIVGLEGGPHHNVVQRLRLAPDEIHDTVVEVRALFAARDRRRLTWEVGDSATPKDLVSRLQAEGMVPFAEAPLATGMVLGKPLVGPVGEVVVREVVTFEDFLIASEIYRICFHGEQPTPAEQEERFAKKKAVSAFVGYLAWAGDQAIAAADAIFLPCGVVMCGGATLPGGRGKGAYRALVSARWEAGRARGTPTLITQAGAMSRPILGRLGFEEVVQIHILLDAF